MLAIAAESAGLVDWLLAAGGLGAFVGTSVVLVRIAIAAERRRADDWRTAAQTSMAANEVLTAHVNKLITSVEQLATTQRDMMLLLQKVANGGPT